MVLLVSVLAPTSAWHAFMDQEVVPQLEGTTLRSDIVLPPLSDQVGAERITACKMAVTSLEKALLTCNGMLGCGLPCAAAWNSATRDARHTVDTPCLELERLMNSQFPSTPVSGSGTFRLDEWETLAKRCELKCPPIGEQVIGNACRDMASSPLAPPADKCPRFNVTSGTWRYPTLTWLALEAYQGAEVGCAGGLSLLRDQEYSTWACVHEPTCAYLLHNDDMACYKYSHLRGEFHFWGFNSALQLVDPLFTVEVSFCDVAGVSQVVNARTNAAVDLGLVHYNFLVDDGQGGLRSVAAGQARELALGGCGVFRLRRNARYELRLDGGAGYYLYRAWFRTNAGAPHPELHAHMRARALGLT